MAKKYDVYQVPKIGNPLKIVSNLNRRQAKNIVKNARQSDNFFVGYLEKGKKPTNKDWFNY